MSARRGQRFLLAVISGLLMLALAPTEAVAQYPPDVIGAQLCPDLDAFNRQQASERAAFRARQKARQNRFYASDHTTEERKAFRLRQRDRRHAFNGAQKRARDAFLTELEACLRALGARRRGISARGAALRGGGPAVRVWMVYVMALFGTVVFLLRRRRMRALIE